MVYYYIKDFKILAQSIERKEYSFDYDFFIREKYIGDAINDFGKSRGRKRFMWDIYDRLGEPYQLKINNFVFPSHYISFYMNPKNFPYYGSTFSNDCLIPIDFINEGQEKKIYINQGVASMLAFFIFIDNLSNFTSSDYLQLYLEKNEAISETIKLKSQLQQITRK